VFRAVAKLCKEPHAIGLLPCVFVHRPIISAAADARCQENTDTIRADSRVLHRKAGSSFATRQPVAVLE
jgi:hypothetical protein